MVVSVRRIQADESARLRAIRLAALADAPDAFATTHAEMVDQPNDFWADRAATNSEGEAAATFIAELDGAWVGMVAGHHPTLDEPRVELVAMWVAPHQRRTGASEALVNAVVTWATGVGAPSVGLWVIRGNERAVTLYERCDFAQITDFDARADDPCADEIRMIRRLG